MRSLPTNVSSNYLKTGKEPHTVVYIPDLALELDTLKSSGVISRSSKPFGGYESAATLSISNLELGEEVTLCTSATITSFPSGVTRGCGKAISISEDSYTESRNATTGIVSDPTITIGQQYASDSTTYVTYRGFFRCVIPAGLTSCEEATFWLQGISKYCVPNDDFEIYVLEGNFSSIDGAIFKSFEGWQASGSYLSYITRLNETYDTAEFFTYSDTLPTNEQRVLIRLNDFGKAYIEANAGSTATFVFLSKQDITNTAPTANEFVLFTASTAELRLRYNTQTFDNKQIKVYRYYGDTKPAYSAMLELFTGVIEHHSINNRTLDLEIRKDENKINIPLPKTVINEVDYPTCPKENIGKPIPLVYGDFSAITHKGRLGSFLWEEDTDKRFGNGNFIKGYICNNVNISPYIKYALFSSHALKTDSFFWTIWEDEINDFVLLLGDITKVTEYYIAKSDPQYFPARMAVYSTSFTNVVPMQALVPVYPGTTGLSTLGENAVDSDYTNWAWLEAKDETVVFSAYGMQWGVSDKQRAVAVVVESLAASGYVSNGIRIYTDYSKEDGTPLGTDTDYINSNGLHFFLYDHAELSRDLVDITVHLYADKDISSKPFQFRNVCICKAYAKEIPNEVFMKGTGRADDVSGTITGVASALIEKPPHVLKSLAISEMGLTSSQLDTTDFTNAALSLADWKFAFQLLDVTKGIDLFNKIGEQSKSSIFRDEEDKLSVKVWDDTKVFSVSLTNIPDDFDIYQESNAATVTAGIESVTRHPILAESLTLSQTPLDQIYNSFELKFNKNYATGDYQEVLTMDNGSGVTSEINTNLVAADQSYMESETIAYLKLYCADSYTDIEDSTRKLTYEADFINDRETAVKLFEHLIKVYTARRYIVEFTTKENAIAVEFGDIINVRHSRLYERFGIPTTFRKKWYVKDIKHALKSGDITLKAIEV